MTCLIPGQTSDEEIVRRSTKARFSQYSPPDWLVRPVLLRKLYVGLRSAHVCAVWEARMNIWTEFKNTILPWLLAAAVVAFLIAEHRRTTEALLEANQRLANAVEQQGKALDGVRGLLASQGYTLPPLSAKQ
jgi:hypothetical protein